MAELTLSDVSLVIPSRNNLKYLKWAYKSIRRNIGPDVNICMADDASNDGTYKWMEDTAQTDSTLYVMRNPGPERVGHTILYDRIVNELVKTPLAIIAHADMYWGESSIENMVKRMEPKTIVSATRIEPSIHPAGPEKIQKDFGVEPEEFNEIVFDNFVDTLLSRSSMENKTTDGVFAPWMFWVDDFKEIGGHDPLFAPQSKEDSDIWNRFLLNGVKFVQTWDAYVYHMTCRGSRYNPQLTEIGLDSPEWTRQNIRSSRNFFRKWGSMVRHNEYSHPIVLPKYDVAFHAYNCTERMLDWLEPQCSAIYVEGMTENEVSNYIRREQKNTKYNLDKRVFIMEDGPLTHDVIIRFDCEKLTRSHYSFFENLPLILEQAGEPGYYEHDVFDITINRLVRREDELIYLK